MPDREAGATFTSFIHGAREALDGWYGLPFETRTTLTELAYLADYRTGIHKTTRNALAKEWGLHPETVRDRVLDAQAKWYAQRASAALRAGGRKAPQRGMPGVMDGVVVDLQARRRNAD